jgi:hypothetical protein
MEIALLIEAVENAADVLLQEIARSAGRQASSDRDRNGPRIVPTVAIREDQGVRELNRSGGLISAGDGQDTADRLKAEVGTGAGVAPAGGGLVLHITKLSPA